VFRKKVVEKIKTHVISSMTFFPKNHAFYEIMWKNIVVPDRTQMTIQYGACALYAG
jgi:hypothetical protein